MPALPSTFADTMTLRYLDFDYSEDDEGTGTWDALASVTPAHWSALRAELVQVLDWAHHRFAGQRGPIEEGGDWDYDLQALQEGQGELHLHYDEAERQISTHNAEHSAPHPPARYTVSLSLSGGAGFGEALQARFGLD